VLHKLSAVSAFIRFKSLKNAYMWLIYKAQKLVERTTKRREEGVMARNMTLKGLISLLVLIAISCSFFSQPILITPASSSQEVSVNITASEGGELSLPDKTVLKIPAGSLQSDTKITLSKISSTDLSSAPENMFIVGGVYDINLGTASLQKPATLEIPFDPKLLPASAESGQVFLSYYDEIKKEWIFAGGVVNTSRNVVILEITHASLWIPATWNWGAWIAVLDKLLSVSIVDFVEAARLLTDDCPQSGQYVQIDSSQALNLIQGCVDVDDSQRPELRIINPKSFYYEIKPISGGNGYPMQTLLAPGDEVKFEASTSDPSPLIIQAEMTQKSGWYLVIHMIITMLPGANQFGIQPTAVACFTERLADVSDIASAVESLLKNDGAAAAESLSNFMLDGDAVRRFLAAADDCHFGPAPTWSIEGIKQIGGAVSTILSSTDYIANYFAGNNYAQVNFTWNQREATKIRQTDGMEMVYVPEGAFTMGRREDQILEECLKISEYCNVSYYDEAPPHVVIVSAFWIDKTEVTNAMYEKCVNDGKCEVPSFSYNETGTMNYGNPRYGNYPVNYVDWTQSSHYCEWAGARLPTEAEWEKAARGTDERIYPWGNIAANNTLTDITPWQEWKPIPVGSYPKGASPYGVLDMAGSLREWIYDTYSETYYSESPSTDPQGPPIPKWYGTYSTGYLPIRPYLAVIRGADYSYTRRYLEVNFTNRFTGFRCALSESH
jgi:formylglycine-generating enzyme required for sulfatase activity